MSEVEYQGRSVVLQPGESVLEGLERAGFRIPNSCRQGLCHACLMRGEGRVPDASQIGLSDAQKQQGCFLACSCHPHNSLRVELPGEQATVPARVRRKRMLSQSVLELSLSSDVRWQPGQSVLLWKDALTSRPYSIASHKFRDGLLVLHIRLYADGEVSAWCHDGLSEGDFVQISPPSGNFVYDSIDSHVPLLMVATGTGLAPLYGILQEALANHHAADIHLYVAAGDASGLYLGSELQALADRHPRLSYTPVVKRGSREGAERGDVVDVVCRQHPDLKGFKVLLCGSPAMVATLGKRCFLLGVKRNDIVTDPFVFSHHS